MKENRKKRIRLLIIVGIMILAGFFYCAGRSQNPSEGEVLVSGLEEAGSSPVKASAGELQETDTAQKAVQQSGQTDRQEAAKTDQQEAARMDQQETAQADQQETAQEAPPETAGMYVHVGGAVNSPGVYELSEGSRVYQAVEAAGGFLETADQEWLNLAEELADGMKLTVFTREETRQLLQDGAQSGVLAGGQALQGGSASWSSGQTLQSGSASGTNGQNAGGGNSNAATGRVNINTADKAGLMTLKGIGEARAESILAYRQAHGKFENPEDIMQVSGIKEAAYEKIRDSITIR